MSEAPVSRAEHLKVVREVAELRARVSELVTVVTTLQAELDLRNEFELISEPPPVPSVAALTAVEAPGSIRSVNGIPPERLEIARCIGSWLKRCLADQDRGQSGREKINLQSRVYLVAREINRTVFNPPKVSSLGVKPNHSAKHPLALATRSSLDCLPRQRRSLQLRRLSWRSLPPCGRWDGRAGGPRLLAPETSSYPRVVLQFLTTKWECLV